MEGWKLVNKKSKVSVNGREIALLAINQGDFISLTDIAKYKDAENPRFIIQNWMRNRNTVEFLGIWESLNNKNFNRVEFEAVKNQAGLNSFVMTPQRWIEKYAGHRGYLTSGSLWRDLCPQRYCL
ncbi:hypothetical protein OfM1_04600 [Lactovum odontotermitis]